VGDVVALQSSVPVPVPARGEVFADARGEGRTLRVTWHAEEQVVVLSVWKGNRCTSTFQLRAEELPSMLTALTDGALGR
jgi:hypothetical protein